MSEPGLAPTHTDPEPSVGVEPRSIPTRRMDFEESLRDLPKHFATDGDLILSHLAACLSSVFPDGEDFFVRSVRHYRDQITDPVLKRQVAGFIGQEAVHGREHRVLNDRLAELGYPTKRLERMTRRALALRTRFAPASSNLAATAALEHFTATLAEVLMNDGGTRGHFGHDALRDLFLWHALEESEHKAVAFDVYRAVHGSERVRVWTMKALRIGFIVAMATNVALSLLGDRDTYRRGVLRQSWRNFRSYPMVQRSVWTQLREYDRPGFHPDDRNTDDLVAHWRDELFGEQGRLNDRLTSKAAA